MYSDGVDANAERVRFGMAWVYERYAPTNSLLDGVQAEAKAAKYGLWADNESMSPWDWRDGKKRMMGPDCGNYGFIARDSTPILQSTTKKGADMCSSQSAKAPLGPIDLGIGLRLFRHSEGQDVNWNMALGRLTLSYMSIILPIVAAYLISGVHYVLRDRSEPDYNRPAYIKSLCVRSRWTLLACCCYSPFLGNVASQ